MGQKKGAGTGLEEMLRIQFVTWEAGEMVKKGVLFFRLTKIV